MFLDHRQRRLCDELITHPEESYRLWCVVVCDLETSRIGAPYIYDISSLRVKIHFLKASYRCQHLSRRPFPYVQRLTLCMQYSFLPCMPYSPSTHTRRKGIAFHSFIKTVFENLSSGMLNSVFY